MASAKRFRRQAETCAALAQQTEDDECRQRYLRLHRMYLDLIEAEEADEIPVGTAANQNQITSAA